MSNRSTVIILTSCTLGIVTIALALRYSQRRSDDNIESEEEDDDDDIHDKEHLPQHLQREIYKEKRRKASIRFLAMKSPMYDNIQMFAPDDQLLCTISKKKATWYVRKDLASWKDDKQQTSIKLKFPPKGRSLQPDLYTTSQKLNKCVCCGDTENHMRHYVVPYSYRTLLPHKYKTHMPHDIVILCPDCNLTCKQYTQRRQKQLERALRKDPETAKAVIPIATLHTVKSKALALLNHRDKIPPESQIKYETLIRKHYKLQDDQEVTTRLLKETSEMDTHIPNPKFVAGAKLVVDDLGTNEDTIEDFVRDWREYFLDTMQPRYLPKGWSISNPVHSDSRA